MYCILGDMSNSNTVRVRLIMNARLEALFGAATLDDPHGALVLPADRFGLASAASAASSPLPRPTHGALLHGEHVRPVPSVHARARGVVRSREPRVGG